jgi:acetyltransferase-like isoleucine patch superfamily enzyme
VTEFGETLELTRSGTGGSGRATRSASALARRCLERTGRVRDRVDAIRRARRSMGLSNAAGILTLQDEAQKLIADGTLVMGRESYFAPSVQIHRGDTGRVIIGNFSSIAHDAEFYSGGMHRTEWVAQYGLRARLDLPGAHEDGFPHGHGDIHVGHDVWVTRGSVVMSGITIGSGAVVGTRSVVTKDVAPYTIVAGVPAERIGQRFSDGQIAALLRIAWWDWPLETIKERVDLLSSPNVDEFIARYEPGSRGASEKRM